MSLKAFHVVFITASTLLAFFFAAWCLGLGTGAGASSPVAGAASAAVGLGLVAYESWFVRKMLPRTSRSSPGRGGPR